MIVYNTLGIDKGREKRYNGSRSRRIVLSQKNRERYPNNLEGEREMVEKALKPRKGLGWKWTTLIVGVVLVVGFFSGAIFTYQEGPGRALPNIGDAIQDLIGKVTGNGGGDDIVVKPDNPDDQAKLEKMVEIKDLTYQFSLIKEGASIRCDLQYKITNLSNKPMKGLRFERKVWLRGALIHDYLTGNTISDSTIHPGETGNNNSALAFAVSPDWGKWELEELLFQQEVIKVEF